MAQRYHTVYCTTNAHFYQGTSTWDIKYPARRNAKRLGNRSTYRHKVEETPVTGCDAMIVAVWKDHLTRERCEQEDKRLLNRDDGVNNHLQKEWFNGLGWKGPTVLLDVVSKCQSTVKAIYWQLTQRIHFCAFWFVYIKVLKETMVYGCTIGCLDKIVVSSKFHWES